MPLVTSTEMFKKAYDGGYAIGAFNVNNMEIIQGITEAATGVNAPCDSSGVQGRPRLTPTTPTSSSWWKRPIIETGSAHLPAPGSRRHL